MLSFLYSITIYPLELAYRLLYVFFADLTGSWGLALLCLSVFSTIIFGPCKKIAAGFQAKEQKIQAVMAPQLAAIKNESSGAERQARIQALYKRYAYYPFLALRSSLGILLQVPFLIAAYNMLSEFTPIMGVSWGCIHDLGRGDALLPWGINFLPLLMTCFNLGAVFTTRNFSRRDTVQAGLIAFLFLALLYTAPSAPLIYWTGNNALLLLGNLGGMAKLTFFPQWKSARKKASASLRPLNLKSQSPLRDWKTLVVPLIAAICAFLLCNMLRAYGRLVIDQSLFYQGFLFPAWFAAMASSLIALGFVALALRQTSPAGKSMGRVRFVLLALAALYILVTFFLYSKNAVAGHHKAFYYHNADAVTVSFVVFIVTLPGWRELLRPGSWPAFLPARGFYYSAITVIGVAVAMFSPAITYSTSVSYFSIPLSSLIQGLLPYLMLWLLFCVIVWISFPKVLRAPLALAACVAAIMVILNITVLTGNYGALGNMTLKNGPDLYSAKVHLYDNGAALAALAIVVAFFLLRKISILKLALQAAVLGMLFFVVMTNLTARPEQTPFAEAEQDKLNEVLTFSRTEPNIIVFFLDAFTGGHVGVLAERYPEVMSGFTGFVWYPDTLSEGGIDHGFLPFTLRRSRVPPGDHQQQGVKASLR